ncbi:DNA polymerase epsilon subunit 3 [Quillaja saponaria]|uniref:DNA polymerase epsilon subunit 3 n=1 Tax=Quillaja saponaria TaxID=32244 RepID=A0AAD7PA12_QUISA|nr:DNA polymerase epsilon subunit 3 [Quillaja saponaria]
MLMIVFKALEEIEFPEFVRPLKASLEEFRRKNAGKKAGASNAKEVKEKRKMEQEPSDKDEVGDIKQDKKNKRLKTDYEDDTDK